MDTWPLVDSLLRDKSFSEQEILSFDQFVDEKLPEIVEENGSITPKIEEVRVEVSNIELTKPQLREVDGSPHKVFWPLEARLRNRTYSGPIHITMRLLRRDVEQDVKRAYIGELPIMIKSKLCHLQGKTPEELIEMGEDPMDFGGYFVINGSEKALMTQEVLSSDRVLVSEKTRGEVATEVISTRGAFKGRVHVTRSRNGMLYVRFPSSPRKLQLFVLLKALGMGGFKEILGAFDDVHEIHNDVLLNWESLEIKDETEALDKIGRSVAPGQVIDYRLKRAREVVDGFLLPHIGQREHDRIAKAYYLGMMASKAIERAYGLRGEDDKDHYANKRLELSGKLMEHLVRYAFKYFVKDLKFQIDRTITRRRKLNISTVVRPDAISERIRFAMSTGNWIGRATGVSKYMDRVNYLSPLTDIRKVKSPLNKNRELYEARDVHGTHWGRVGPIETPDGPQCVSPDTEIFSSDLESFSIDSFENHWKDTQVLSVDWENKKENPASAVRYLAMNPKKPVLKLQTKETGRTIVATNDHPFYCERLGKTPLKDLAAGDRVAVLPAQGIPYEAPSERVIVAEQDIRNACPPKTDVEYTIKELKQRNLLPLRDSHSSLPALARLVGHACGDGSLTLSMKKHKSSCAVVFTGEAGDLEDIRRDVASLGFSASKQSVLERTSVLSDGRVISGKSRRMDCYAKPLWVLLHALGAPSGDKAAKAFRVPSWLRKGRKLLSREFLAAYFGSEMGKPAVDKHDGKTFLAPVFSFNKTTTALKKGLAFVEDIKELLERFGVRMVKTKILYGTKRKSGEETRKVRVYLSSELENALKLYSTIGFAYCQERKSLARMASGYLSQKRHQLASRAKAQQAVLALAKKGLSRGAIAKRLGAGLREHDISNWLKKKTLGVRVSEMDFPLFNTWMERHAINEEGLLWETIQFLAPEKCNDVRDITTREHYHNFFANGFLTGNCGLVKNLALFSRVTTESKEEPLQRLLEEKGVSLG